MRRILLILACLASGAVAAEKPRELVHAFPATGPAEVAGAVAASRALRTMQRYTMPAFTDIVALHAAQALQGWSDEPATVVRKTRQSGNEAAAFVANSAPDGRTLLLANARPRVDLKPLGPPALMPVAAVVSMPYVLIARSEANAERRSVIEDVRAPRGRLLVASPGERSVGHVAIEELRSRGRSSLEPLAYNGGHAAMNALATKQVSVAIVPLPAVLPYLGGGRLKALVIAQAQRHASIPAVQTSAEAGIAELQASTPFIVFSPAATPPAIVSELRAALVRAFDAEGARQLFSGFGLELGGDQPGQRGINGTTSREGLPPPS